MLSCVLLFDWIPISIFLDPKKGGRELNSYAFTCTTFGREVERDTRCIVYCIHSQYGISLSRHLSTFLLFLGTCVF